MVQQETVRLLRPHLCMAEGRVPELFLPADVVEQAGGDEYVPVRRGLRLRDLQGQEQHPPDVFGVMGGIAHAGEHTALQQVEGFLCHAVGLLSYNPSSSSSHSRAAASEGIRQSPRGDRATLPTLGPSGRQERLNCWAKNRQ